MSCQRPDSWSFTNTDAEICIAETRTMPSLMPAAARHFSTSSVISMISWRRFVLNVKYDVWTFVAAARDRRIGPPPGARARTYLLRNHLPGHAVRSPSDASRLPDAPVPHPDAVCNAAVHCSHGGVGGHAGEDDSTGERERSLGTGRSNGRNGTGSGSAGAALTGRQGRAP